MKRLLCIIAVVSLLALCAVLSFAEDNAGTDLRFVNTEETYSITAYYDVLTADVSEISVSFDDALAGNAFSNYIAENHQLRISVASLEPINLARPVGVAVAVTTNDESISPQLKLTMLKYNGVRSSSNIDPQSISGVLTGDLLTARLAIRNDLMGPVEVMIAAYDEEGRYLTGLMTTLEFTTETQVFDIPLGEYPSAVKIKAFFLTGNWKPYTSSLEGLVQ